MIIVFDRYVTMAFAGALILISGASVAAQTPAASTPTPPPVAITEDSGAWRRDPFIGSAKKGGAVPAVKGIPLKTGGVLPKQESADIHLQGIMQSGSTFHALINGRSVKTGDSISGVTIKEISRFKVIVLNERREKVIYDIYQGRIDRGKQ